MADERDISSPPSVAATQGWLERAFPPTLHTIEMASPCHALSESRSFPVRRFELLASHGTGYREFSRPAENLHLMLSDFQYGRDVEGKAQGHDFLKFHFKISGHNLVRFERNQNFLIDSGKSVIAFHPKGLLKDDCYAARAHEFSLTLSCEPSALLEVMRVVPSDLPTPLSTFFSGNTTDFFCQTLPLTQEMVEAIGGIVRPRYDGHLRRLHIEARSLDLICMLLDMLQETPRKHIPPQTLRPRDIEALHAVRTFVASHYAEPPSIPALARQFGLNRTKLTEGFRGVFGQTVFNYIQSVRMQTAKQLLLESQLPVAVVAHRVGYERPSSFATAFREYHGFPPRSLKKLHRCTEETGRRI
jgi:AraC-like DNA-binding protein